ncbi:MAG: CPBP family intramembrane metalloprotease [Candidatus Brockarchaeota archaeon]|nr:CPBP family intramembrane metalloprotease [Candidatus Brockarchaeota archaeon]
MLWGFLRMWSPALSAVLCLAVFRESVSSPLKKYLGRSTRVLKLFLLSPLIVYAALGVYMALSLSLGLFDFNAYVELLAEEIAKASGLAEEQAVRLATVAAYTQIASTYVAAITINTVFTLGEEIGWRGYLYDLLGSRPTVRTILAIGTIWGLWHASSILLLGHNYQVNRVAGIVLFTAFTILFTYPQLLLTDGAGKSVLPASSFHGAINAVWGLTVFATRLPRELGEIVLGLGFTGIASWMVLDVVLHLTVKWFKPFQARLPA